MLFWQNKDGESYKKKVLSESEFFSHNWAQILHMHGKVFGKQNICYSKGVDGELVMETW